MFFFVSFSPYTVSAAAELTRIRTSEKGTHVFLLHCIFRKDSVFVYTSDALYQARRRGRE